MSGDELNLILSKFARHPLFCHHAVWHFHKEILVEENTQYFCILVCIFSPQNINGLDAGLDGKI